MSRVIDASDLFGARTPEPIPSDTDGKVIFVDFSQPSKLTKAPVVSVSVSNALGIEDGLVYLVIEDDGIVLRYPCAPEEALELARDTAVASRVAARRAKGLYELELHTREDKRVPQQTQLARLVESRGTVVLLEFTNGDQAWYSIETGEPVKRDHRCSYWRLCQRDAQHLRSLPSRNQEDRPSWITPQPKP